MAAETGVEKVTYHGSCHCGNIEYTFTASKLTTGVICNCSICSKSGAVMTFVDDTTFSIEKGEDYLVDYQFNSRRIHHTFCKVCGMRPFARGTGPDDKPMVMINLRCVEDLDLDSLKMKKYDGKSV